MADDRIKNQKAVVHPPLCLHAYGSMDGHLPVSVLICKSHPPAQAVVPPGKPEAPAAMLKGQSRGAQAMADSASESSLSSDSARKPRCNSFFSLPRLFVGLTKGAAPDSDPARSPTSPLDCKVFSCLGSYLARSPRSPHCDRVGLGLVDALNDETNAGNLRVLSSATSPRSLPKNYVMKSQTRAGSPLLRPSLPEMAPELPRARFLEPGKPVKAQPCSMDRSFLARQDVNLDVRLVPPFIRAVDGGSSSGSLPITPHGFIGSLSAGDIEQSEDYTCIISRGPNPKTTHIFGDRILETHTTDLSDADSSEQGQEKRGTSWMVTCSEDPTPSFPSEDFLRVCYCCKKKLEGKDIYMYRGEKAFCSCSCRSQEILVEGEMEEPATGSSASPRSASCEEIFFPGMDVAA